MKESTMRLLLRCRRGTVAMMVGLTAIPAIGLVALGTEAGVWYATQRQAQNAADAAAYSGALRLAKSDGQTMPTTARSLPLKTAFVIRPI
jgi:Flp pilus assembly protein TadG